MHSLPEHIPASQNGFSLVEILVGLVIGLLATLVIMQVFTTFEGDKRTTTGTADAQTNGAIALYQVQRDIQSAGFGLPVFDSANSPYQCNPSPTIDHDSNVATPDIDLFPITIIDGGVGASDAISVRYGNTSRGGMSVKMVAGTGTTAGVNGVQVDTHLGCQEGDTVLVMSAPTCSMTTIAANGLTAAGVSPVVITLNSPANLAVGNYIACMGIWNEYSYTVNSNQLVRTGVINAAVTPPVPSATAVPVVADIVDMQAQYGVSVTANSNQVTQWVDAAGGDWAKTGTTPTVANRNRIKAIRVAVVARSGAMEKTNVSTACSSVTAPSPTGVCAWTGTAASPAPVLNLTGDPNWQRYRYRVYETMIPLRNVVWSKDAL